MTIHPTRRNAWVRFYTICVIVLGVFGVWAARPYLAVEMRRLEPWKVAAMLCGDAIALMWFTRFAVTHLVLGKPLIDEPAGPRGRAAVGLFLASMIGGLALDVGMTVYLHFAEIKRYEAALPAIADVRGMSTHHGPKGRNYTFDCVWKHPQTGQVHETTLRVHASAGKGISMSGEWTFPLQLPGEISATLLKDQAPKQLPIRYDPAWPGRTWIQGVPDDENGLFYTSLFVHFGQAVAVLLITLTAWTHAFGRGGMQEFPWWMELARVIPTAAQVLVIAFMGAIARAFAN